jgi:membrane protease YdiL (CAAX protease family)
VQLSENDQSERSGRVVHISRVDFKRNSLSPARSCAKVPVFDINDSSDRSGFLNFAAVFEGGLMLSAFALGWMVNVDPVADLRLNWIDALFGVLFALPMLALFLATHRVSFGPIKRINQFLIDTIGPFLASCRVVDLVLLATLAGVCEEIVFRGFLQPWFGRLGAMTGLIGSNIVFALAHFVTPTYAIAAFLIGIYLAMLLQIDDSPNLLVPIVTHTVYDFVAFLVILRSYRAQQRQ